MPVFFGTTSVTASASAVYDWVKIRLGNSKVGVELELDDVISAMEEANNEYSFIINTHQIKNYFTKMMGSSTANDLTYKNLHLDLTVLKRLAQVYANETESGGTDDLLIGYVSWTGGQQSIDLLDSSTAGIMTYLKDKNDNAITATNSIILYDVYYNTNPQQYSYYYDSMNLITSEFGNYGLGINGGTYNYIYPMWADMANASYLKTQHRFRKSNYRYLYAGKKLYLFPAPTSDMKIWLKFRVRKSLLDDEDSFTDGINSIANAPYNNFDYTLLNDLSQAWIRKYTLAICKEILGRIRSKFANIPIPNGNIDLDGKDLINEGKDEQQKLKDELLLQLENLSLYKTSENDAQLAQNINQQLKYIPLKPRLR